MIKKYSYVLTNSYKETNQSVFTVIVSIFNPIVQVYGMVLFYNYLIPGSTANSLQDISIYFLFVLVVASVELSRFSEGISDDIRYESYLNIDKLPINPFLYYFLKSIGRNILVFCILLLISLLYMIITHYNIWATLLFIPSVVIGFLISHLIFFTATCLSFYSENFNPWFFNIIFEFISGKRIPINFMPAILQTFFLSLMPFIYAFGGIARNFSSLNFQQLFISIGISLVWCVILFYFSNYLWNKGSYYFQENG